MVQGAPQVAGRFPELLRMYKGPPPEVSSEQFYETDPSRGFARGFSIQTRQPAADRLGRARARRRPPRRGAARVHARLQPLGGARRAVRAAAAAREPGDTRRREGRIRDADRRASTTPSATTTAPTSRSPSRRCTTSGSRPARRTCSRSTATRTSSAAAGWARRPETSVVDADHRVWGTSNVFVCDGSVMPTQGSANPALTIMALASRLAERLAARIASRRPDAGSAVSCTRDGAPPGSRGRRRHRAPPPGSAGRSRTRSRGAARRSRLLARGLHGLSEAAREVEELGGTRSSSRSTSPIADQVEAAAAAVEERFGPHRRVGEQRDGDDLRARSPRSAPRSSPAPHR